MRRVVAILIAMLFSFTLIVPLFAGAAASNVPACCRNNGKHRCQMKPTAGFAAIGERCPVFAHPNPVSPITTHNVHTGQAIFAGLTSQPADVAQTEAGHRMLHARAKQKRGPPSFLS